METAHHTYSCAGSRFHAAFMHGTYSQGMRHPLRQLLWPGMLGPIVLTFVAGCGTLSSQATPTPTDTGGARTSGDVPDTAVYLSYRGPGYHIKYVEGWGIQLGPGKDVSISDKDSSEVVTVTHSTSPLASAASSDLSQLRRTLPQFHVILMRRVQLAPGSSIYTQYRTLSPPDPVTSKRVPVVVDRYFVPGPVGYAMITLSTPAGVDNVDAFRLIARSFRWG